MSYFCWRCKTIEHWADEPEKCRALKKDVKDDVKEDVKDAAPREGPSEVSRLQQPEVAAPIKEAQEFIEKVKKKVGRPRIYDDPKARRREYMRGYRARQK